jgi:SHS2 domain-containing protein
MPYKFLEHTADIKIVVEESSLENAFSSSAFALREMMLDFEKIKINSARSRVLSVEGKNLESLLYNFLEEFIFLLDAEDFIFSEFEDIEIFKDENGSWSLSAKILGDRASNYKFSNKVKAITYNNMFVKEEKSGKNKTEKSIFKIQFVLDV